MCWGCLLNSAKSHLIWYSNCKLACVIHTNNNTVFHYMLTVKMFLIQMPFLLSKKVSCVKMTNSCLNTGIRIACHVNLHEKFTIAEFI